MRRSDSKPDIDGCKDPSNIRRLFEGVVHCYDLLNSVLSLGLHMKWREEALRYADMREGMRVLDLCTGTGDMAIGAFRRINGRGTVAGLDFCDKMLQRAISKYPGSLYPGLSFLEGDALNTPFADNCFDTVTVAFGLRNLAEPERALQEIRRVLRLNGRLVILDFTRPAGSIKSHIYGICRKYIVPAVGGIVSGNRGAYQYLSDSIDSFDTIEELVCRLVNAGFAGITARPLTMGVVSVFMAEKH
jgi:demethylmenaquinone methyltransferase/2-methoxy-6-polyprenyl-1,4-benzoquinol methylase